MPRIRRKSSNLGRRTQNVTNKLIFYLILLHRNVKSEMKLKVLGYYNHVPRVVFKLFSVFRERLSVAMFQLTRVPTNALLLDL